MVGKQRQELEEFHDKLSASISTVPKPSTELQSWIRKYRTLAKEERYAEAAAAKHRAEEIHTAETKHWAHVRATRIAHLESQLIARHKKEREMHAERAQQAIKNAMDERDRKLRLLAQNFINTEKHASNMHSIELARSLRRDHNGYSISRKRFAQTQNMESNASSSRNASSSIKASSTTK